MHVHAHVSACSLLYLMQCLLRAYRARARGGGGGASLCVPREPPPPPPPPPPTPSYRSAAIRPCRFRAARLAELAPRAAEGLRGPPSASDSIRPLPAHPSAVSWRDSGLRDGGGWRGDWRPRGGGGGGVGGGGGEGRDREPREWSASDISMCPLCVSMCTQLQEGFVSTYGASRHRANSGTGRWYKYDTSTIQVRYKYDTSTIQVRDKHDTSTIQVRYKCGTSRIHVRHKCGVNTRQVVVRFMGFYARVYCKGCRIIYLIEYRHSIPDSLPDRLPDSSPDSSLDGLLTRKQIW